MNDSVDCIASKLQLDDSGELGLICDDGNTKWSKNKLTNVFFQADHDISTSVWLVFRSEVFFPGHPGYEVNTDPCHASKI